MDLGQSYIFNLRLCHDSATLLALQVLASLYALSELLRLQVLWGPHSVLVHGGYHAPLMCRIFTALTFGFLEPAFLLLALFSCVYSVQVNWVNSFGGVESLIVIK